MQRLHRYCLLALVPAMALMFTLGSGCTAKKDDEGLDEPVKPKATGSSQLKELAGTGATLKGKVTLDGGPPDVETLDKNVLSNIQKHPTDRDTCLMGKPNEINFQGWRIKDGAVENVYVWLRPPDGSYFKLDDAQKKPPQRKNVEGDAAVFDQPHCAFIPHSQWLFPKYSDGKSQQPTGQYLVVKNSAPIAHNTNISSLNPRQASRNPIIPSGSKEEVKDLNPDLNVPVKLGCNIHGWMSATLWVFDHPFVAITDENGEYEIKNAPADKDVQVVVWHEQAGFLNTNKGEKISLKAGVNKQDFKIKPK